LFDFTFVYFITSQVEEDELSAGLSPCVGGPDVFPGNNPLENKMFPETVNGPPLLTPVNVSNIVRQSFGEIWSVPFVNLKTPSDLEMMLHPSGKTCPESGILTSESGMLIWGRILYAGTASTLLVLHIFISIFPDSPIRTTPAF